MQKLGKIKVIVERWEENLVLIYVLFIWIDNDGLY